jgi:hypothetical protein
VITNAANNNPSVKGLVYLAAFAPNEGQSLTDFVDSAKFPKGFLLFDSGGFIYINPEIEAFAQDKQKLWPPHKSQLVNLCLLKNLVHELGSNYLLGTKSLRMTTLSPLLPNRCLQNK